MLFAFLDSRLHMVQACIASNINAGTHVHAKANYNSPIGLIGLELRLSRKRRYFMTVLEDELCDLALNQLCQG